MQTRSKGVARWKTMNCATLIAACVGGAVYASETNFLIVKSFGNLEQAVARPIGRLVEGSDGRLYGASAAGGKYDVGTVFRLNKDGTDLRVIFHFSYADAQYPNEGVIEGSDGRLYGTTAEAPGADVGTVFTVEKDGSGFQVLHRFVFGERSIPFGGIIEGSDGVLYGRTLDSNTYNQGGVYRIGRDGSDYGVIASFGSRPGGLAEGSDGSLYGTTERGGVANAGMLYRMDKGGSDFRIIHSFGGGTNGATPGNRLVFTSGILYGTTATIDETNGGCIYRMRTDGSDYAVLKRFGATITEGRWPALSQASDGLLYGALAEAQAVYSPTGWTQAHYGALFKIETNGQNFALLHTFNITNGAFPSSPMLASDGLLYGATENGGGPIGGGGVLYRLRPEVPEFEVLKFVDGTGGGGARPIKLVRGSDGKMYGMTTDSVGPSTGATVYRVNTNGSGYAQFFSFGSVDAHDPTDLIEGRDGLLYATSYHGGTGGRGVVVRIPKDGSGATVLRSFAGPGDGSYPQAVVHVSDGRLYGTVYQDGLDGLGFVFSMRTNGSDYRVVYRGGQPTRLMEGSDGWLYGSRSDGLYRLHPSGSQFLILRPVVVTTFFEGNDGLLYGATPSGGRYNAGTLFKMSKTGQSYEPFFDLPGGSNRLGVTALAEGADGLLYGIGRFDLSRYVIFRVGKQGQRYAVVRRLYRDDPQPSDPRSLVEGSDLAMYVATYQGGDMNLGTILRFVLPPDIELSVLGDVVRVSASGLPNRPLHIERSPDLANWITLGTSSVDGRVSVDDTNAPGRARFYRAVTE